MRPLLGGVLYRYGDGSKTGGMKNSLSGDFVGGVLSGGSSSYVCVDEVANLGKIAGGGGICVGGAGGFGSVGGNCTSGD